MKKSGSFLKKRTEKLLLNWSMGGFTSTAQFINIFCALFLKKRRFLTFISFHQTTLS
jgi:hypothetical protein